MGCVNSSTDCEAGVDCAALTSTLVSAGPFTMVVVVEEVPGPVSVVAIGSLGGWSGGIPGTAIPLVF